VKGQKHQSSQVVHGTDSPCWAMDKELAESGGWTFKTGHIEPEKLMDMVVEFEVMQTVGCTSAVIGAIQMGVNSRPVLTDPKQPFKNIWLPLYGKTFDNKNYMHKSGELHIMTRWTPADKMHQPQPSIRAAFMKELWPRLNMPRIKEPIYQIEPQFMAYDANLFQVDGGGASGVDLVQRHLRSSIAVNVSHCTTR